MSYKVIYSASCQSPTGATPVFAFLFLPVRAWARTGTGPLHRAAS
jgi:hypothetical protein